jgi:hypothetical protein
MPPCISVTAIATGQLFFLANASAAAIIFLACSSVSGAPQGGALTCACTVVAASATHAAVNPSLISIMSPHVVVGDAAV